MISNSGNLEDTDQCCFWSEDRTSCFGKALDNTYQWLNVDNDNEAPSACIAFMKDKDKECSSGSTKADCNTAKKADCCFSNTYYNSCYGYGDDGTPGWLPITDYGANPGCASYCAKHDCSNTVQCKGTHADCDKAPDGLQCCFKDNTLTSCWGNSSKGGDGQFYPVTTTGQVNDECSEYLGTDDPNCTGPVKYCTQAKASSPTPPAPPTPPTPPAPPAPHSSNHTILIIILAIVAVVIMAVAGYLSYKNYYKNKKPQGGLNNYLHL